MRKNKLWLAMAASRAEPDPQLDALKAQIDALYHNGPPKVRWLEASEGQEVSDYCVFLDGHTCPQ